jgi:3-oxoadipate enol-lactonase
VKIRKPTKGKHARRRVVLLHSALGDSRLWRHQVAALQGGFDVAAPDLPGFGSTPEPDEPFSFVDAVRPLLPGALVGNSFGGTIALRLALAYPDLVDRLVLIAAGVPEHEPSRELHELWAREQAAVEQGDLDAATDLNLAFWLAPEYRAEVRPQQLRALELQTSHPEPELRWPELAPLSSLAPPTLVVVGDRDVADFREMAEQIVAEAPNAELFVVPNAGHIVGLEQPEALNRLLLRFLAA